MHLHSTIAYVDQHWGNLLAQQTPGSYTKSKCVASYIIRLPLLELQKYYVATYDGSLHEGKEMIND